MSHVSEDVAPRNDTARVDNLSPECLLSRLMLLKLSVRVARSSSLGLSSRASPMAVSPGRMKDEDSCTATLLACRRLCRAMLAVVGASKAAEHGAVVIENTADRAVLGVKMSESVRRFRVRQCRRLRPSDSDGRTCSCPFSIYSTPGRDSAGLHLVLRPSSSHCSFYHGSRPGARRDSRTLGTPAAATHWHA